jgi:hypothetical protein
MEKHCTLGSYCMVLLAASMLQCVVLLVNNVGINTPPNVHAIHLMYQILVAAAVRLCSCSGPKECLWLLSMRMFAAGI